GASAKGALGDRAPLRRHPGRDCPPRRGAGPRWLDRVHRALSRLDRDLPVAPPERQSRPGCPVAGSAYATSRVSVRAGWEGVAPDASRRCSLRPWRVPFPLTSGEGVDVKVVEVPVPVAILDTEGDARRALGFAVGFEANRRRGRPAVAGGDVGAARVGSESAV